MDWQEAASLAIVAVTAVLLVWGRLRARRTIARDCCGECGKLETHLRKGYHEENVPTSEGQKGWMSKKPL